MHGLTSHSYCTLDELLPRLAQYGTLDENSIISPADVKKIMADNSSRIDLVLTARGIAVPVDQPAEFVDALKAIAIWGSMAEVLTAMFPDSAGPANQGAWAFFENRFNKALDDLRKGVDIPSAVAEPSLLPRSFESRYGDEEPAPRANVNRKFSVSMEY